VLCRRRLDVPEPLPVDNGVAPLASVWGVSTLVCGVRAMAPTAVHDDTGVPLARLGWLTPQPVLDAGVRLWTELSESDPNARRTLLSVLIGIEVVVMVVVSDGAGEGEARNRARFGVCAVAGAGVEQSTNRDISLV
jgi:hypothetical protein